MKLFFASFAAFALFASGCFRFVPTVREQQRLNAKGAEFAKDAKNCNGSTPALRWFPHEISSMTSPELDDLRKQLAELEPVVYPLDESPEQAVAHSLKLGSVAAICCEAFRRYELRAVLVGGGVIELLLPGAYTTPDIDLVISQHWLRPPRSLVDHVFKELGFERQGGRHWIRDGWFVEVPGFDLTDPTTTVDIAGHQLDIVLIESVLVGRLVEYDQTGHTGHATQALMILEILDGTLNEPELSRMAKIEGVQDVLSSLRAFLRDPARTMVTDALLRTIRDDIHLRRRGAGPFFAGG